MRTFMALLASQQYCRTKNEMNLVTIAVRIAIAVILPLVLTGCLISRWARIEQNRSTYERWPSEIRNAVSHGTILKGMSSEMVRVAWGNPSESSTDPYGTYMYWLYPRGDKPALKVDAFQQEGEIVRRAPSCFAMGR